MIRRQRSVFILLFQTSMVVPISEGDNLSVYMCDNLFLSLLVQAVAALRNGSKETIGYIGVRVRLGIIAFTRSRGPKVSPFGRRTPRRPRTIIIYIIAFVRGNPTNGGY